MPELKRSFQSGRMNKDLDERLVPNGEYIDAMNIEVSTSVDSEVGTVQTILGNVNKSPNIPEGYCVGKIVDEKNDKLYWLVSGNNKDYIAEYDYASQAVAAVCVDIYTAGGPRALYFDPTFLVTGINIIDDILFWTDNNSEPKRINITRGKLGSTDSLGQPIWNASTEFQIRDVSAGSDPNTYVTAGPIKEEHLTVIKKSPPNAPVLEMKDTPVGDHDQDGIPGETASTLIGSPVFQDPVTGKWANPVTITTSNTVDFKALDYLIIRSQTEPENSIRVIVDTVLGHNLAGNQSGFLVTILSGERNIFFLEDDSYDVELSQAEPLFQFKFPRFAYRYKYEDGEYSTFSPFTEVAFLPGEFNYLPKEGYNLGMVNNLRKLVIKDFVHDRLLPDDVISIDLLYKESNSANIYTVKTIPRQDIEYIVDNSGATPISRPVWDAWNGISASAVNNNGTRGFFRITSEMIHAVLPANQLLRPWDNVPRKTLAQEITKNRLVYGNYLQNYDIFNSATNEKNIDVQVKITVEPKEIGTQLPEQRDAGINDIDVNKPYTYKPGKSIKSLRTYQLGVVYIDEYGRETPVFSSDKRGATPDNLFEKETAASIYLDKDFAVAQNKIKAQVKSTVPEWAKAYKFFIKETSNEYYNLAMDRWYDAEDGNIWISFPSSERNKVDIDTYLILKKEHDNDKFVDETARYKIVAIENEAPHFVKLSEISMGSLTDDGGAFFGVPGGKGFPDPGEVDIYVREQEFIDAGWEDLVDADVSEVYFRIKSASTRTKWYRLLKIGYNATGLLWRIFTSKERFGQDMSITTAGGTGNYSQRIKNLTLEVVKRIPEEKPEFQGRFFVKIAKDFALIDRIIKPDENETEYIVQSQMLVQYINPKTNWAMGSSADWFGQTRELISIDSRNGANPSNQHKSIGFRGHGDIYWDYAGNTSNANSSSSGWFIDKVEAFRKFKYTKHFFNKDNSSYVNPGSSGTLEWLLGTYEHPKHNLQVCGLNTYNESTSYLWINKLRAPKNITPFVNGTSGDDTVRDAAAGDGGKIPPSIGIDVANGIIHLSYAGIGKNHDSGYDGEANRSGGALKLHLEDDMDKHAADITFINDLTTPGSIWRWQQDPDQTVYKTKMMPSSSSPTPYTADEWKANQMDVYDQQDGVGLYNYVKFTDYTLQKHHRVANKGNYCVEWPCDWVSRNIDNHHGNCLEVGWEKAATSMAPGYHTSTKNSGGWGGYLAPRDPHWRFPNVVYDWNKSRNKRRRYQFHAVPLKDETKKLGEYGESRYLPTNDPDLPAHFSDADATVLTTRPSTEAPGIRSDGVYSGYILNGVEVPSLKTVNTSSIQSTAPGSVMWQILQPWSNDGAKYSSTNPAIFETEPKEDVGLDIYHEVGQIYPVEINNDTIEQFVGPVHDDLTVNSSVLNWSGSWTQLDTGISGSSNSKDIRVSGVYDNFIELKDIDGNILDSSSTITPAPGSALVFVRADGSSTESYWTGVISSRFNSTWWEIRPHVHNNPVTIPWFNCYSFGNGVESDRIRDDFNQVTIDNGPIASTTLEEPYLEERRTSGLIYSGIYNSKSGINNLNQFIQAEKITKDLNPTYGSIQKLHTRNTDLLTLCEDKILKVLANKDALYNADGNMNLTATANVLGQTIPISGEFGISKNPESFASESYRTYFTDKTRGTVLRLSQDGLTPISNVGMKDWFGDNLRNAKRIIGSVDDERSLYNITLLDVTAIPPPTPPPITTYSQLEAPVTRAESGGRIPNINTATTTTTTTTSTRNTWDCIGGHCVDPGTGLGQYTTLVACQRACETTVTPPYPCPPSNMSSRYYIQPYNGMVNMDFCNECMHAGPGSAMWISSPECLCCNTSPVVSPSWSCVNGHCIDPGNGSGDFGSLRSCQVQCASSSLSYDIPPDINPSTFVDSPLSVGPTRVTEKGVKRVGEYVNGCMDPTATNYNPLATIDNGSCIYSNTVCTTPTVTIHTITSTSAIATWNSYATAHAHQYELMNPTTNEIVTSASIPAASPGHSIPFPVLSPNTSYNFNLTTYCVGGLIGSTTTTTFKT